MNRFASMVCVYAGLVGMIGYNAIWFVVGFLEATGFDINRDGGYYLVAILVFAAVHFIAGFVWSEINVTPSFDANEGDALCALFFISLCLVGPFMSVLGMGAGQIVLFING